jgi:hypothetical protein
MNLKELSTFKLHDAIFFHDELNPVIFMGDKIRPEVRQQLMIIAEDFVDHLGIQHLAIEDVTLSGSNASYTYTKHSDIDLHILVDMKKLNNDAVYRELFDAKKTLYNDTHNIKIGGYEVELYVQDSNQPVVSLGEYSVMNDSWLRLPKKSRANFDQNATKLKFNKLAHLIELALKYDDQKKIKDILAKIKSYRKTGLDMHGEFGPENLAFKALRSKGLIGKLYDKLNQLHSEKLSLPEEQEKLLDKPTLTLRKLASKHHVLIQDLYQQLKKGIKVEMEHTNHPTVAKEIAMDHLDENPYYYDELRKVGLEEGASGYIPSPKQKNDPRYKTGLTVDVTPNSIKDNAKKLGSKISRAGIPPLLRP